MIKKRLCKCGCGEALIQREDEKSWKFKSRRYVTREHYLAKRKREARPKTVKSYKDRDSVERCGKCGQMKAPEGLAVEDKKWWCGCEH